MINFMRVLVPFAALALLSGTACACAQDAGDKASAEKSEKIIVPKSSEAKPGDTGKKAHTNYLIGNGGKPVTPPKPASDQPSRN